MDDELFNVKKAASYLGISIAQLYKLNAKDKIPRSRPSGGKLYYLKSDLYVWALSGRRSTEREINSKAINSLKRRI
jgi:predicted DNA-binding transcriptional regulator AlpA